MRGTTGPQLQLWQCQKYEREYQSQVPGTPCSPAGNCAQLAALSLHLTEHNEKYHL